MSSLKGYEKKALVQLQLKHKDTKEDKTELGFAVKVKKRSCDETAIITSSSVLPGNTFQNEVVVNHYSSKSKLFGGKPSSKVKLIEAHDTMEVSVARFEGGDKEHFFNYKALPEKQKKESKMLSAFVFEGKEIIELKFGNKGGSYHFNSVSKTDFDVKRAKGAPVIYQSTNGENVVVGVLTINDQDLLYPVLFQDHMFDTDQNAAVNDETEGSPTSQPDQNATVNNEAEGSPTSQLNQSGDDDDDANGIANDESNSGTNPPPKPADGRAPPNITYNVHISGNPQAVIIGEHNIARMIEEADLLIEEEEEKKGKNLGRWRANQTDKKEEINGQTETNDQNATGNGNDETEGSPTSQPDQSPADVHHADDETYSNLTPHPDERRIVAVDGDAYAGDDDNRNPASEPVGVSRELVGWINEQNLQTADPKVVAIRAEHFLKLDKIPFIDPPPEIVEQSRWFCVHLKQIGRLDVVKELKVRLPNGMTGPIGDKDAIFQELPYDDKKALTEAISGNEEVWKGIAEKLLNIPASRHGYYSKKEDPAEKLLEKFCLKRRLRVGQLYDILVKLGAASLADEYL